VSTAIYIEHFPSDICPDKNVPVIAVFTKFDQFKHDIKMKLEDEGRDPGTDHDAEMERVFNQYYLASLSGPPPFVRLERMHKHDQQCTDLIEVTANALTGAYSKPLNGPIIFLREGSGVYQL